MTLFKPRVGKVIFAQTIGGLSVIIPIEIDIKLEEIIVRGDRLLLNSLFMKDGATVIFPLSLLS